VIASIESYEEGQSKLLRVAVLQRVLPQYRVALFKALSMELSGVLRVFIGEDILNSKVRSAKYFEGLDVVTLPTRHILLGNRVLTNHIGLVNQLRQFGPDVIICEGESNLLNYLKVILYFKFVSRQTIVIHWSLGGLPGAAPIGKLKQFMKRTLLSFFDSYIVYSSFGKDALIKLNCDPKKITVAVNVSDTSKHIEKSLALSPRKRELRTELGLPGRFTVIYVGDFSHGKRIEVLIEAAIASQSNPFSLLLLGDGVKFNEIKQRVVKAKLDNVFMPGRVDWETLARYYAASDLFVLPGLGGMVISEAMAFGLPVLVHQADGCELDLVIHDKTGYRLTSGGATEIYSCINTLRQRPEKLAAMGEAARSLVVNTFTIKAAAQSIQGAVYRSISF
jgi:glycosyltransferase involved in cell wall biosynthesis